LDKFVEFADPTNSESCTDTSHNQQVMGYYDGNTVTAFWNYPQRFAMSDNSFNTIFGPSTPGAINLISDQTHGALPINISDNVVNGTVIGDPDPLYDNCGDSLEISMTEKIWVIF
jgi:phospholipase C